MGIDNGGEIGLTAIYVRVSSSSQDVSAQEPDLKAWVAANKPERVTWFTDVASGKTMSRPGWTKFLEAAAFGAYKRLVVWRVDRLGRTAKGLTALFEWLQKNDCNLVSLRDGLDLSTPAGRLMANVLASVAQFETEIRGERVRAGIAAAKAKGKRWGGAKKGRRLKVKEWHVREVKALHERKVSVAAISRSVRLAPNTVYAILRDLGAVTRSQPADTASATEPHRKTRVS